VVDVARGVEALTLRQVGLEESMRKVGIRRSERGKEEIWQEEWEQ
jgi:hypothetical protein